MKSKRTRNRPKEKKPRSRAGAWPSRSVAKLSELRRPSLTVAEEGCERLEVLGPMSLRHETVCWPCTAFGDMSFLSFARVWERRFASDKRRSDQKFEQARVNDESNYGSLNRLLLTSSGEGLATP